MFIKKPFTLTEQVTQLQERGLIIKYPRIAEKYLINISYYRLGEYWYVMQSDKEKHIFKPNSRFENVIALYNFDAELRLLLFDVIEKIEISFRTKMIYHLSHEADPFWFQNKKLFVNKEFFNDSLNSLKSEIKRSKDTDITLVKHYDKHQGDNNLPPAWKTIEHTSLSNLSKMYGNLHNSIKSKKTIAKELGAVNHTYLPSWLQSLTQIRNICAHHSRLWNRNLPSTVKLLSKPPNAWITDNSNVPNQNEFNKLYIHMCLMKYVLNTILPKNQFGIKLNDLLKKYPNLDPNALGMKPNWQNEPLWQK
jgi:abortive infection bacteriophage resistance protein